ncbi:hypothetical protein JZ751_030048, partial [Albula glossodonta]
MALTDQGAAEAVPRECIGEDEEEHDEAQHQCDLEGYTLPSTEWQGEAGHDTTVLVERRRDHSTAGQDIIYTEITAASDECETLEVSKDLAVRTEAYFYQGGQVTWLNFHLAENEAGPVAQTTPSFIKRDSYEEVAKLVDNQRRGCQSVSCINLFHEPGSGGTTLAMHVLWDFRKKLRCAVLRDDKSMVQDIANQVITLFQVGGPGKQNTVLLLIDNLSWAGDSQLRKGVTLQMELSEEEQDQFNNKKEQVRMLHGEHSASFHGFNIMQNGFSEEYVKSLTDSILNGALARFLYLSHPKNYSKAEFWARKAIERAPDNSFIADTLGQVHKNHLKNEVHQSLHRQLELARKAIDAFQYQQKVAENEEEAGASDNDPPYIREQVTACFLQYVTPGAEASEPLTDGVHGKLKRKTAHSFAGLLHWLYQKNRRTEMTEINKLWTEVINSKTSASPSEVLCYLLSNVTLSCVQPSCPFILPFASLKSQVRSLLNKQREELPELFFLALVLLWPDKSESSPSQDEDQEDNPEERDDDLNNLVRQLEKTYDKVYQKYLRSRYLLPHFFLRNGTQYGRIVHRSQVDLWLSESNKAKAEDDAKDNGETQGDQDHAFNQWRSEAAWKNDNIQEQLLRVQGIVKGREVFACYGQLEILVHPDNAAQ